MGKTMTLSQRLKHYQTEHLRHKPTVAGKLTRVVGLTLEAVGCRAPVGSLCMVETLDAYLEAEVVGFSGDKLFARINSGEMILNKKQL